MPPSGKAVILGLCAAASSVAVAYAAYRYWATADVEEELSFERRPTSKARGGQAGGATSTAPADNGDGGSSGSGASVEDMDDLEELEEAEDAPGPAGNVQDMYAFLAQEMLHNPEMQQMLGGLQMQDLMEGMAGMGEDMDMFRQFGLQAGPPRPRTKLAVRGKRGMAPHAVARSPHRPRPRRPARTG
eukprot:EG_transcript_24542